MPKTTSDPCAFESVTPTIGMILCARKQAGIQASSTRSQPSGSGCGSAAGGVRVHVRRTVPPRDCSLCSMLRGGQSSLLRSTFWRHCSALCAAICAAICVAILGCHSAGTTPLENASQLHPLIHFFRPAGKSRMAAWHRSQPSPRCLNRAPSDISAERTPFTETAVLLGRQGFADENGKLGGPVDRPCR